MEHIHGIHVKKKQIFPRIISYSSKVFRIQMVEVGQITYRAKERNPPYLV